MHHMIEVGQHLGTRGQFVESGVRALRVLTVGTERERVDPVERGGLVQAHEWIRIVPVTTGLAVAIDHHHRGVGLGEDHVGERHAHRTRADHEVVGRDRLVRTAHRCTSHGTTAHCTQAAAWSGLPAFAVTDLVERSTVEGLEHIDRSHR